MRPNCTLLSSALLPRFCAPSHRHDPGPWLSLPLGTPALPDPSFFLQSLSTVQADVIQRESHSTPPFPPERQEADPWGLRGNSRTAREAGELPGVGGGPRPASLLPEVRQPGAVTELALLLLPAAPLRRTHTRAQTRTRHAQAHACAHAQIHIHIYHTHTRVHTHTHRPHTHTCIHCVPHVYTRTHTCILDIQTCAHA